MVLDPKARRAARHLQPAAAPARPTPRREPLTVERIIDAALHVVATQGYEALTIRAITAELGTSPSSLYVHVVNKADIDDLIIGRLNSELVLPEPDPDQWREQILQVYAQIRDQYLRYPGISRATLAAMPTNLETLRVSEAILAILLAGGIAPQTAAWAMDSLSLYVAAYTLEISLVRTRQTDQSHEWVLSRDELLQRLGSLPADRFPHTRSHAAELTSGSGHQRFDFTLNLMLDSLTGQPPEHAEQT
ncbi:TetR/AcrR family transcriptional regulator [Amycolatopsis acidiphila]|uniref:TetR/AcrR family transcriptional regulator n=1 Tax=Amycolatopsis acidiphila TaxID=715473 RepID=A0A558ANX1_9PSEU|nr:TetR/AcrR family transcriptional regulator [Amycolatopsis acidiphila]TVT25948.1 TetR/AcrR family transcriptional regulator [Amycolatopsis acidiphila]UIJ63343.1 TetR/AcrR family transcriptional regulator [Amycolatopsis acidiphila]GHG75114.1 TetR family transcriptional regulator [Amycolatopsis acidiphila]